MSILKKTAILLYSIFIFGINAMAQPGVIRVNSIGYLPDDIKAAVFLGDFYPEQDDITLTDSSGNTFAVDSIVAAPAWQPGQPASRIYFSSLTTPGIYTMRIPDADTVHFRIGKDVYATNGLNELPLNYLRQQRCGFNPIHGTGCHHNDGFLVLAGDRDGEHVDVTGGWHDASDYLQYLTTSANTVYQMLFAYTRNPEVWADNFDSLGKPGSNNIPDILDEARWGLEWMLRMNPEPGLYLNQIADDRDHRYVGVPANDSVDYGRGPGNGRPVYPCSGKPYGLFDNKNRSTGQASSVAKFASSFGLGAQVFAGIDKAFADTLDARSHAAYLFAEENPGACQTAPCRSPYFYEEDNWTDDLELAAFTRYRKTGDTKLRVRSAELARMEPVTPWMGADSARHYQWYPFLNLGHYHLAADRANPHRADMVALLRQGIANVAERGKTNAFRNGVPFIWCSNNLAVAFVTQAMLYRDLTGDNTFREAETAVRDWLFGVNPWGQTMIIGAAQASPSDPHSALTDIEINGRPGVEHLAGGLVDGPVYSSIFNSLKGVHLRHDDHFASWQGGRAVYHDDFSDYSTNEPTMDGTASLTYMLGRLAAQSR
ncbi:MAG: glycoside hydrolase family 9 protein [Bacteroidales bacterium]|nr:glycoside hydrolase family 9 protein [Bacteroidales bacterium]